MWEALKKIYDYLLTFPERLYPFSEELDGQKVTGEKAYKLLAVKNKNKYGDAYALSSPKLLLWRQVFHVFGSVVIILIADFLFRKVSFFNGFIFLGLFVFLMFIQEFYLHPHHYEQKFTKGLVDFISWILPIIIYILL
ncbi:MAG: hypothetical protein QG580_415 [Patescibacteria group bacterium]|jgi:hypothetical protein|nr:hypothetical protein [Patescibacteria group bacterium]